MPAGRPPKPEALAWLQGDPGKRRRYQTEPPALEGAPVCPDWLANDQIAKAEWDSITSILSDMRLLSRADVSALAAYCEAWSRYRKAIASVAKTGPIILSPNKQYPMINPQHTVMRQALADVTMFLREFGLTPAARARMSVTIPDKPVADKWAGILPHGA